MRHSKTFIFLITLIFATFVVVFNFLPRPTFSELERRQLSQFPEYSTDKLADGSMASEISSWYSDTEPFREELITMSMKIKKALAIVSPFGDDDEPLSFHADENTTDDLNPEFEHDDEADALAADRIDGEIPALTDHNNSNSNSNSGSDNSNEEDQTAHVRNKGIVVVGKAPHARALMAFGGTGSMGGGYASVVNKYKEQFPDINVFCMVIPNSSEFYMPEKAANLSRPQIATIENIHRNLAPGVKAVNVHAPLKQHKNEDIFLRTDHHWAPLGAYYAAREFARVAGVPFKDISTYEPHTVHGFVGTMYGYSKDIAVKESPEDFVYYTPTGVDYTTTYYNYRTGGDRKVTSKSGAQKGPFFYKFKDGSGGAYSTFMGGDQKLTQVKTSTHNGRRLVIFKDSFGNAIPGYLFHSFEEIHVIDFRYFTDNIGDYLRQNGITDILFANNTFMVTGNAASSRYNKFLTQKSGPVRDDSSKKDKKEASSSNKSKSEPKSETQPVPDVVTSPEPTSDPTPLPEAQPEPENP